MKSIFLRFVSIFTLLFAVLTSSAQVQIYVLDFESSGGYTTSMSEQTDSGTDYFIRTDGSNISGTYNSPQGSYFFAAQNIDADGMSSPATLTIDDINISGYDNLELRIYIAEDDAGDGDNDWDNGDYMHIDYDIDNSGSFSNAIWIENDGSTYNSAPYLDADYDGTGENPGTEITDTFSQLTKSISATGSLMDIKITFGGLTSSDEDIAVDYIEIWGTAASTNDTDSEVTASSTLSEPATISSLTTSSTGLQVFDFTFTDNGSGDGLATIIDEIIITQGSANAVADWTNAVAGAVLNGPGVSDLAGTVSATSITFGSSGFISVADGSANAETFTLSIWLKSDLSAVNDNDVLEFAMNYANITTQSSGSAFGSGAPESGDTNVKIDISATELRFAQQPSNTNVNNCMSPDVTVEATDANGNRDTDFTSDIRITSTGTLSVSPTDVTAVSGLATFSGADCINHTISGTNLTLNAERTSGLDWDVISNQFDITDINACGLEEFTDGTTEPDGWTFTSITDTYTTSTNYGTNPPSLKMDATGDAVETADVTSPSDLSFWIKGQGTDASSALLVEGWDGSSWNTVDNIVPLPTSGTVKTYNSGLSAYTKFKFTYNRSAGNLAFDDVDVTCGNCEEPTTDANTITFPTIGTVNLDLSWNSGNGGNRIVVCRKGIDVSFVPSDNITYPANSDYSAATEVGTAGEGNKVVYNGSASSVSITGLLPGTDYYFAIYEYGCSSGAEDYYTNGTPATANETTLPEDITNFTLNCITNTTAEFSWDLPVGNFDGILITVRESTLSPSSPSCDGATLTAPDTDFSTALEYCGNTTSSKYVYNATGTSLTITGLTPNTDYVFKAFTYKGALWSSGTLKAKNTSIPNVTGEATTPGNSFISIDWINPTSCYDEILVVAHEAGSVSQTPSGDGSSYTANATFGAGTDLGSNDYVVYKGINTSVDVTSLTNGTQYCFKIFTRKGTDWSSGIEVCDIPADVTIFKPGEFVIIGFDSKVSGSSNDAIYLMNFVDIKEGTTFKWVNSRFETGAAANERTMHWGGAGDKPYQDPSFLDLKWEVAGQGSIPAGSVISFETYGNNLVNVRINGVSNSHLILTAYQGFVNVSGTEGDQMWLVQGDFTPYGTDDVDKYNLFSGTVLFGLTSIKAWVDISSPVRDDSNTSGTNYGRESRIHPDLECFNIDLSLTGDDYIYYKNGTGGNPGSPLHTGSKRALLLEIQNSSNWNGGTGTTNIDINEEFIASTATPVDQNTIGKRFSFLAGNSDGTWIGGTAGYVDDWFTCKNWESLTVPNNETNVTIPTTTDDPRIDHASSKAVKYNYFAECNNITIDNATLYIEGSANDTLKIYGDLTIQNSANIDMDDAASTRDGIIYLAGNWNNTANFTAGNGTIVFNGTNTQSITNASGNESFSNLRLNNPNISGVTSNVNLVINDTLSQTNNLLDLNAHNIEINGVYENINSYFTGDIASDMTIGGSGIIGDVYFKTDFNLNNLTMNRNSESLVIKTNLDINGSMTISDGNITLSAPNFYTANSLTNTVGTAGLTLKSDASGTASLLHNTAVNTNAQATCERYLSADVWHFISIPLSNVDKTQLSQVSWGMDNPNFYWYDESVQDFWKDATLYAPMGWQEESATTLNPNRAYIHEAPENRIHELTGGNLNDDDITLTLHYTGTSTGTEPITNTNWTEFHGWNLLVNPYPCAIDWNDIWASFVAAGTDGYLENGIYFLDGSNSLTTKGAYQFYTSNGTIINDLGMSLNGGSQMIPANQSFFVKATPAGDGQTITIPKSARKHSLQTFWKAPNTISKNIIRLAVRQDYFKDETIIRSQEGATDNHDYSIDAYKMFSWDKTKPQLYSTNDDHTEYFGINTIDNIIGHKVVKLGYKTSQIGTYSIESDLNTYENIHVWLEDTYTEELTSFDKPATYNFYQSAETNTDRFYLHFNENTAPTANTSIPNQTTAVDKLYTYTLPENLFIDNDFGDELTISATLTNGEALPDWLTFNAEAMTLTGTPAISEIITISIKATDIFNESVTEDFILEVRDAVSVNEIKNSISVYPNPANNFININSSENGIYKIYSVEGKFITQGLITNQNTRLNTSTWSDGIYIIEINTRSQTCKQRIVKQ